MPPHRKVEHKVVSITTLIATNVALERFTDAVLPHMQPVQNVVRERDQAVLAAKLAADAGRFVFELLGDVVDLLLALLAGFVLFQLQGGQDDRPGAMSVSMPVTMTSVAEFLLPVQLRFQRNFRSKRVGDCVSQKRVAMPIVNFDHLVGRRALVNRDQKPVAGLLVTSTRPAILDSYQLTVFTANHSLA